MGTVDSVTGAQHGRGLVISPSIHALGASTALDAAAQATRHGYESVWTPEGRGLEATTFLGGVVRTMPDIAVGTGILPAPLHRPSVAALAVATLQALDPDRLVRIGIGVSSPVVAGWHGADYPARPIAYLREYVTVLRRVLSGERVVHRGAHFAVDGLRLEASLVPRQQPEILLAALNPGMLALAAEVADGVLLNAVPVSQVETVAQRAADAGNETLRCYVHGSVSHGGAGAPGARRTIVGECMAQGYARAFRAAGYGSVVDDVLARLDRGDLHGAGDAVPLAMCEDLYAFGSAEVVEGRLAAFERAGVQPLLSPELVTESRSDELAATVAAGARRINSRR